MSPLTRKTPLARSGAPSRKRGIRKSNPARKSRLFKEDFDSPEFVAWIHSLPCARCGAEGLSVAAHTRSRGAGGKASDVIPLCDVPHDCHGKYDRHEMERTQRAYLKAQAPYYWQSWKERGA